MTSDKPEIKARPTLYKGIRMRSRLEADYAAWLDRYGFPWEYEPTCFADETGQWLPDFRIPGSPNVYLEIKPASLLKWPIGAGNHATWEAGIDGLLRRMSIAWETEQEASLDLTFWEFGAPDAVFKICAGGRGPWRTYSGDGCPAALWTGMGQMAALPPANPRFPAEPESSPGRASAR